MYIIDLDREIFQKNLTLFKEILEPLFHYISLSLTIIEILHILIYIGTLINNLMKNYAIH